jgi:hypothetical protein
MPRGLQGREEKRQSDEEEKGLAEKRMDSTDLQSESAGSRAENSFKGEYHNDLHRGYSALVYPYSVRHRMKLTRWRHPVSVPFDTLARQRRLHLLHVILGEMQSTYGDIVVLFILVWASVHSNQTAQEETISSPHTGNDLVPPVPVSKPSPPTRRSRLESRSKLTLVETRKY